MTFNLSHTEKALIAAIVIELILIILLFNLGFQEKPKEVTYAVDFVADDFDFDELKPDEKLELPDIKKYVNQKYNTNVASNVLQEEKSFEEYRQHHEEELEKFYENRQEKQNLQVTEPVSKPQKDLKKEVRFTGDSNIRYFLKNRHDVYMANPLYTCPDYMSGLVVIDIALDRTGKVIEAKYNKAKSTASAECLVESALEAAQDSFFNSDPAAPLIQRGYITYNF